MSLEHRIRAIAGTFILGSLALAQWVSPWWLLFTALSITGNLIPFTLITWAEVHIASGQAGLLMALVPISTLVLAHFFVAHEQITGRRLAGVALGFCGVAVMVGADTLRGLGGPALVAQLAVVAATFSYAVNNIFAPLSFNM